MKKWQKYWLYFVILFYSYHLIRDVLQDAEINVFIADIFVKSDLSRTPSWYWVIFNTYIIEIVQLIFASICLKRRQFGFLGEATVVISVWFAVIWLFYWFLL